MQIIVDQSCHRLKDGGSQLFNVLNQGDCGFSSVKCDKSLEARSIGKSGRYIAMNFTTHKWEDIQYESLRMVDRYDYKRNPEKYNTKTSDLDSFKEWAETSIQSFRNAINFYMVDGGDKEEESQKLCVLDALKTLESSINGVRLEDLK